MQQMNFFDSVDVNEVCQKPLLCMSTDLNTQAANKILR